MCSTPDKKLFKVSLRSGRSLSIGLLRTDNANYLRIQLFHSALNEKGRAVRLMTTWSDH